MIFGPSFDGDPVVEVPMPFLPIRLLFADQGRMLLAVAEDRQLATVDPDGMMQILSWPPEREEIIDIAVAADASILAVLRPGNVITILGLAQSSVSPKHTIDAGTKVVGIAIEPSGQRVYAVVERLGLDVVSWRVDAPDQAPAEIATIRSGLPPVPIAFSGADLVAMGDGFDLLFVPNGAPEAATRRGGHDEPVGRIATGAGIIASVACWFQDTRVDQIRLWDTDGQPLGPVTLPEHAADIVVCPDGSSVVALGHSGMLWRVTLRNENWIETARRIAGRGMTAEEQRRYGVDAWRARSLSSRDE